MKRPISTIVKAPSATRGLAPLISCSGSPSTFQSIEKNNLMISNFSRSIQTDVNHFVSKGRKFITKTEFINSIFFRSFFDLIVLFFRFLIEHSSRWTFQFEINVIIATCNDLKTKSNDSNLEETDFGE